MADAPWGPHKCCSPHKVLKYLSTFGDLGFCHRLGLPGAVPWLLHTLPWYKAGSPHQAPKRVPWWRRLLRVLRGGRSWREVLGHPSALPSLAVGLLSDVVIRPGRGKYLPVPLTTLEAEPPCLLRWQTPDSHGQSLMTCHGRLLASPYLRLTMFAVRSSPQGHPHPRPPAHWGLGGPQGWRRGLCSGMDVAGGAARLHPWR